MNFTGASTVASVYLCPSATRQPDGGNDGVDPERSDHAGIRSRIRRSTTTARPLHRHRPARSGWHRRQHLSGDALSQQGSRVRMGCSTRARRASPRSPTEPATRSPSVKTPGVILATSALTPKVTMTASILRPIVGLGPAAGNLNIARRYWRWAEPDTSYGVSGQPNNKFRPSSRGAVPGSILRAVPRVDGRAITPVQTTSFSRFIPAA